MLDCAVRIKKLAANSGNFRVFVQNLKQWFEPAWLRLSVVVEKQDEIGLSGSCALVAGPGKTLILLVPDGAYRDGGLLQKLIGSVAGGIVHDDGFVQMGGGVCLQGTEACLREFPFVVNGNDNGYPWFRSP